MTNGTAPTRTLHDELTALVELHCAHMTRAEQAQSADADNYSTGAAVGVAVRLAVATGVVDESEARDQMDEVVTTYDASGDALLAGWLAGYAQGLAVQSGAPVTA